MSIRHLATEGMDASQVAVLTSLLRLLRRSLESEWRVNAGEGQPDAILTDLDTTEGRLAWSCTNSGQAPRIAATSSVNVAAQWLVVKPWHRAGENGLVDVLNRIPNNVSDIEPPRSSESLPARQPAEALAEPVTVQRSEPSVPTIPVSLSIALDCVRSSRVVALLTMADLPPLYIDGAKDLFSCRLPVAQLLHELWKRRDLYCEVREIRHQLSNISDWKPLVQLEWLIRITSQSPEPYRGEAVLKRWPEFIRYPGEAVHLRMASLLLRKPFSAEALASGASATVNEASAFVRACDLLQLIHHLEEVAPVTAKPPEAPPPLPVAAESSTKAGFLRKVINTLLKRNN